MGDSKKKTIGEKDSLAVEGSTSNSPKSELEILYYDSDENNAGVLTKGEFGYLDADEVPLNPFERKLSIEEAFGSVREGILKEMKSITAKSIPLMVGSFFSAFALFLETSCFGYLGKKRTSHLFYYYFIW
ncbi:hypothetical protein AYI68_g2763 [Smittium mucronatum]|uniref:Uncharacterized protein n=1 Tax=Smittium mucronatum TaxID=133383 RepID=A0A1R0H1T8_9FUNG|nr:hypothetical protein AYI68_g2763 [Smittium mucronatum]